MCVCVCVCRLYEATTSDLRPKPVFIRKLKETAVGVLERHFQFGIIHPSTKKKRRRGVSSLSVEKRQYARFVRKLGGKSSKDLLC